MGRTCSEFSKFREPNKSLNHECKDPVSHMCLVGVVVAYWYLKQETASLSPFTVMINIFITEFAEFSETFGKNSIDFGTSKETSTWAKNSTSLLQNACCVPCVDLNQENNCGNYFVCQKCFEVTIVRYLKSICFLLSTDLLLRSSREISGLHVNGIST